MKKPLFFLLLLTFALQQISAQNEKLIDQAEDMISIKKYTEAGDIYKKLLDSDTENPELNFRYGFCLLNTERGVFESIQYLEKAAALYKQSGNTSGLFLDASYTLAKAYNENYMFEFAIETYKDMLKYSQDEYLIKTVNKDIETSQTALQLFTEPKELVVSKLGVINSHFSDHSPVISGDESILIFTSRRENSTGGLLTPEGEYYEDVYIFDRSKGIDAKPENIGAPINTDKHEATCGLSIDGQTMFLYRSNSEHDGNIYCSKLTGDKWSVPEKLNDNINSKYRETHATISSDGNFLYFSSNRKDGLGGYDIYVSEKKTDGTWGKAKNLGKPVNTEFNEEGPYIHADGKTLYFSSNGHPGMGGYDVFFSKVNKEGQWSKPENMGFPLNTVDNDVFYVPTADGKRGYYSSQQGGVSNIYIAQLYNEKENSLTMASGYVQNNPQIKKDTFLLSDCTRKGDTLITPNKKILFSDRMYFNKDSILIRTRKISEDKVTVTDSSFKIPQNVSIYVIDADTKILENSYSPNSLTGKYIFVLNTKKNYKIYYEAKGYIFDTKDVKALKNPNKYNTIFYEARMDTLEKKNLRKSKKIGFEPGTVTLNSFTVLELEILSLFLKKHEDLLLNITGYDYLYEQSDRNYFPLEYEFALERKNRVINYLEQKGINPGRIFTDIFPADITGDTVQYTIFTQPELKKAVALKEERKNTFTEVVKDVNKTQEQIFTEYGLDSISQEKIYIIKDIQFEINQYTITDDNNTQILADYLKQNPEVIIEIGGYTDEQGDENYNYDLAGKRAEFVKNQLIKKGTNPKQIKTKTYAFNNPIATNKNENGEFIWEALPYNRRVEFKILKESPKSNLIVKNIDVPQKYKIINNKTINEKTFAISLLITETQQKLDDFENIKNVTEKQYSDGTYMYFYGEFTDKDEVINELSKIKTKFPDAFIFVKSF